MSTDSEIKVLYGHSVVRHESACHVYTPPLTRWDRISNVLAEVRFIVGQSILFAASFVCFMYAFGAFRAHG